MLKENIVELKPSVDGLNVTIGIQTRMIELKDNVIETLKLQAKEQICKLQNQQDMIKNGCEHHFVRPSE